MSEAEILFSRDYTEDSVSFGWVGPDDGRVVVTRALFADPEAAEQFAGVVELLDLEECGRDDAFDQVYFQRRHCDFCRLPKPDLQPSYGTRKICAECATRR